MEHELNYFDLTGFLSKCVLGEIDLHEPLEITNKLKNRRHEVSPLQHLLILCRSDSRTLINILSIIRNKLREKIVQLINDNSFVRSYIQNIIYEWNEEISPLDIFFDNLHKCGYTEGEDIFNYQSLIDETKLMQKAGGLLDSLEEEINKSQSTFVPMTSEYADSITDKVRDIHQKCYNCMNRVRDNIKEADDKYSGLKPKYMDILLDLSTKCKSSYLEFSNKHNDSSSLSAFLSDKNNYDIPDNINTIFLNYTIVVNMLRKEMNYITKRFHGLLEGIKPKTIVLTKFMDGVNLVDLQKDKPNNYIPDDEPITETKEGNQSLFTFLENIKEKLSS